MERGELGELQTFSIDATSRSLSTSSANESPSSRKASICSGHSKYLFPYLLPQGAAGGIGMAGGGRITPQYIAATATARATLKKMLADIDWPI